MGNTTAGGHRGSGRNIDDDFAAMTTASGRRPMYPPSQDSAHGDDSVISILTEGAAIADHIRDGRRHTTGGMTGAGADKARMYVGAGGSDCLDEVVHSVPTVFKWEGGGKDVYISGTFNGWKSKIQMVRSSSKRNFYTIVDLPLGEHQYKFIVDGQWRTDHNQPIVTSQTGVQNNMIHVKESDFDVLTALSHDMANSRSTNTDDTASLPVATYSSAGRPADFTASNQTTSTSADHPPLLTVDVDSPAAALRQANSGSPPGDYTRTIPASPAAAAGAPSTSLNAAPPYPGSPGDGKRLSAPPLLPPQLLQVILNRDTSVQCDPNLLPQPDHVMVNHMYALSIKDGVIVLSAITRFRQKFVSTVLYKPI